MNAYEGKAGMVYLHVKLRDPCLSALRSCYDIKALYKSSFLSFPCDIRRYLVFSMCLKKSHVSQ